MKKIVFITGASSGIGAALAEHYSACGADVGLLGRNAESLALVKARCENKNVNARIACAASDVTHAPSVRDAMSTLTAALGLPDIVIANAGVSRGTLAGAHEDVQAFKDVFDTNVLGLVHTFTPVINAMVARGSGTLVVIASVAGLRGIPGSAAYSASKAAAISYGESLRVELRASGVNVLTMCPGYIDTPMTRVNTFPMPFLLSAEAGARRLARLIDGQRRFAIMPWQMSLVGRLMRALPVSIYDALFSKMPRKPR